MPVATVVVAKVGEADARASTPSSSIAYRARCSSSSTPRGPWPAADGAHIRRAAAAAHVAVPHHRRRGPGRGGRRSPTGPATRLSVRSLQEHHAELTTSSAPAVTAARRRHLSAVEPVDLTARVGSVVAAQPGDDRVGDGRVTVPSWARYFDLAALGAVVVKSLVGRRLGGQPRAAGARPARRDAQQRRAAGPRRRRLARRRAARARRDRRDGSWPASGAGRVEEYRRAGELAGRRARAVVAVEVNVSCPNLEDRRGMFAHSPVGRPPRSSPPTPALPAVPRWAKLSPERRPTWPRSPAPRSAPAPRRSPWSTR